MIRYTMDNISGYAKGGYSHDPGISMTVEVTARGTDSLAAVVADLERRLAKEGE